MGKEIAIIFLLWFALQILLGIIIGKCIHFGMSEARTAKRRQASSPFGQGITTWWRGGSVLLGLRSHNMPLVYRAAKFHRQ